MSELDRFDDARSFQTLARSVYGPLYAGVKDKHGRQIKVGDLLRDGHGVVGVVEANLHPWGFERLQYAGLSVTHTAGADWYEILRPSEEPR